MVEQIVRKHFYYMLATQNPANAAAESAVGFIYFYVFMK